MKLLIVISILTMSPNIFAMTDNASSNRLATPPAATVPKISENAEYNNLASSLDSLRQIGSVSCNTSYRSPAHALVCNCANEAGNQSLEGMTAVSRVVFSRAKSPAHPDSIKGVVCERHQFSWTIGGWDSNCNRTRGNPTYFNTKTVTGSMLAKCTTSAKTAARLELVEEPTKLYALNYCSTNPRAYRNAIPSWCRSLINSGSNRVGDHAFGFANGGQRRTVPARGSAPSSISFFQILRKFSIFSNEAHAATMDEVKIVNTRADKKTYYGEKISEILKKKYKNFSPYAFSDYSDDVKELMGGTRNNLPASAIGDYNGDGKKDLILMGSKRSKHMIVAFVSRGNDYKDYVVSVEESYKKPLDIYLVNIQKSKAIFNDKKARDAFQVEKFGGAAIAKFFDGKKFVDNNSKTGFKFK